MRKNIKILLTITIITIILLVGVIINLISNNKTQLLNKSQIIKEMTSSAKETELNNQINELNAEHEEYAKNVQNYKKKIAEAITSQGVQTSEDDTIEIMVKNIEKILQSNQASFEMNVSGTIIYMIDVDSTKTVSINYELYLKVVDGEIVNKTLSATNLIGCQNAYYVLKSVTVDNVVYNQI